MGLFEGVGGFSLAARWAGWQTPAMVELDPYCQAVLKKNFPDATIFSDIRSFDGRPYAGQIDIITGGFPCQPFSHAGKRAGANDDRYLWPEMLRVIREVKPAWVVGENVAGLLSMDGGRVLRGILADLENAGYCPEVFVIPAIAVGAPHRRDRVWIVAHSNNIGSNWGRRTRNGRPEFANENSRPPANAPVRRRQRGQDNEREKQANGIGVKGRDWITANANLQRRWKCQLTAITDKQGINSGSTYKMWREHWYEVATRICGVDDGIPGGMDGVAEIPTKKNTGKAQRLEALGNAIVPQVAYQIFQEINQHYAGNI